VVAQVVAVVVLLLVVLVVLVKFIYQCQLQTTQVRLLVYQP
jgi:hypothetical protein